MDFDKDIEEYLINEFNFFGHDMPKGKIEDSLLKLFTIQQKYIFPTRRKVEISNELKNQLALSKKYLYELIVLKMQLERGEDINAHQSSKLFNYHVHDQLVYHWKIFHLHLNFDREGKFTKRTKEVLFVYIDNSKALFLKVEKHPPHDVFADKVLLEIIDNNWEEILTPLKGVIGLSHNLTTHERFKLRKHGITEGPIEVNGKFFFSPGLGQMASGHSHDAVSKLLDFQRWRHANEKGLIENKEKIDKLFIAKYKLAQSPKYKIVFTDDGPEIWDGNSNFRLIKYREQIVPNR